MACLGFLFELLMSSYNQKEKTKFYNEVELNVNLKTTEMNWFNEEVIEYS